MASLEVLRVTKVTGTGGRRGAETQGHVGSVFKVCEAAARDEGRKDPA